MTLACSRLSSRSSAPARGILEHRGFFQFTHWGSTSTGETLRKECKTPNLCRRGGADGDKRGVKHLEQDVKVLCLSQLVTSAPEERAEQLAGAGWETRAKGRQSSCTQQVRTSGPKAPGSQCWPTVKMLGGLRTKKGDTKSSNKEDELSWGRNCRAQNIPELLRSSNTETFI